MAHLSELRRDWRRSFSHALRQHLPQAFIYGLMMSMGLWFLAGPQVGHLNATYLALLTLLASPVLAAPLALADTGPFPR